MIRIAILGCGNKAADHVRHLIADPDAAVVACCDVDADRTRAWAAEHVPGEPAIHTDPTAMYAEAAPDAVVIVTPHALHHAHAIQALEAGCHVLCEKPMVTDPADGRELAARVAAGDRIFAVGYNSPTSPVLGWIRDRVRERTFGDLRLVSGWLAQDWQNLTRDTWRQDPDLAGAGQAGDSGAHCLCSLLWIVDAAPREVFAGIERRGSRVDIDSVCTVRFDGDVRAAIAIGGSTRGAGAGMQAFFAEGRVDFDPWAGRHVAVHPDGRDLELPDPAGRVHPATHFLDCIRSGEPPLVGAEMGLRLAEFMDAFARSAREGVPVAVGVA